METYIYFSECLNIRLVNTNFSGSNLLRDFGWLSPWIETMIVVNLRLGQHIFFIHFV